MQRSHGSQADLNVPEEDGWQHRVNLIYSDRQHYIDVLSGLQSICLRCDRKFPQWKDIDSM